MYSAARATLQVVLLLIGAAQAGVLGAIIGMGVAMVLSHGVLIWLARAHGVWDARQPLARCDWPAKSDPPMRATRAALRRYAAAALARPVVLLQGITATGGRCIARLTQAPVDQGLASVRHSGS